MANEINVNTYMVNANWNPTDKLELNINLAYSDAESEISNVSFLSDPHNGGDRLDASTPWKGTYDVVNVNNMEAYSRLDYCIIDLSLAATYAFTDNLGLTVNYLYSDMDDKAAYVYGDEDGNFQSVMSYVTFKF